MTAQKDCRRSPCPVAFSLDLIGDRWTLLVVRDMVFGKKRHFREFLESPEGIATNILTDRLQRLEEAGVVSRRQDPSNARKVIYELTEKGKDLIPALLELIRWGAKYDPKTGAPKQVVKNINDDREGMIENLKRALE
jgi:DNA-binding HxlR family transcriptional regulator